MFQKAKIKDNRQTKIKIHGKVISILLEWFSHEFYSNYEVTYIETSSESYVIRSFMKCLWTYEYHIAKIRIEDK